MAFCSKQALLLRCLLPALAGAGILTATERSFAQSVGYDIAYVRYPGGDTTDLPMGEHPYRVAVGGDLVLLRADGSEQVLVNCDETKSGPTCSVYDTAVSFDGEWVYYMLVDNARDAGWASFLYKLRVSGTGTLFQPIRLTFGDGFESARYAGNTTAEDDMSRRSGIRDMAPAPLPDGRIAFTSNRAALVALHPDPKDAAPDGVIQQLYLMDDHDGKKNSAALSNLHRIDAGTLHLVQHPVVLQDGRLMFSSWHDAGTRIGSNMSYAMTSLFVCNPDGSNFHQLTEPHDAHKNLDHFATQLGGGAIVTGNYYPNQTSGFGMLARFPIDPPGIPFTFQPSAKTSDRDITQRYFDRVGWTTVTPHTFGLDCAAPNRSGKYSMPSAAPDDGLLVSYSKGGSYPFDECAGNAAPGTKEPIRAGIYLLPGASTASVTNPDTTLRVLKDDPAYNEIWPRALVPYQRIHGRDLPQAIREIARTGPEDDRIVRGSATALLGTSSMWNRQTSPRGDSFPTAERNSNQSNWGFLGAEVGKFTNADIWGVRIVMSVPRPYTREIDRFGSSSSQYFPIQRYLLDDRTSRLVHRYGSGHGERWEILGEFPVVHPGKTDPKGDPDSSFIARVPADTPLFIQAIDKNGMTLFSELTWRALRPGELRADCGGCHAHSIPAVDFGQTASGRREALSAPGLADDHPAIAGGIWDLTNGVPLLEHDSGGNPRVRVQSGGALDVEFTRDIKPLLDRACVSCHATAANTSGTALAFDGQGDADAYAQLTRQRYTRVPQARQSLLIWAIFGKRLDGRTNAERSDDVDFTSHPAISLSAEEKLRFARWVDMGTPIDFPGANRFRYTDDNLLPVINVDLPRRGANGRSGSNLRVGLIDAESGIDWSTLKASVYKLSDGASAARPLTFSVTTGGPPAGVVTQPIADVPFDTEMVLMVEVRDKSGNVGRDERLFTVSDVADEDVDAGSAPPGGGSGGTGGVPPGGASGDGGPNSGGSNPGGPNPAGGGSANVAIDDDSGGCLCELARERGDLRLFVLLAMLGFGLAARRRGSLTRTRHL